MKDPREQGVLHAELDGILVGDSLVAPVPAQVAVARTLGIAVLKPRGQLVESREPLFMLPGFAECHGGGKQGAAAQGFFGVLLGNGAPEAVFAAGTSAEECLTIRWSRETELGEYRNTGEHQQEDEGVSGKGGYCRRAP